MLAIKPDLWSRPSEPAMGEVGNYHKHQADHHAHYKNSPPGRFDFVHRHFPPSTDPASPILVGGALWSAFAGAKALICTSTYNRPSGNDARQHHAGNASRAVVPLVLDHRRSEPAASPDTGCASLDSTTPRLSRKKREARPGGDGRASLLAPAHPSKPIAPRLPCHARLGVSRCLRRDRMSVGDLG